MRFSGLAGTNLEQARGFNRRIVLETIRLHGPLSRADITRATALSPQTVSNIADELCSAGLLQEEKRPPGARGAPGFGLALNPEGGFTFGISLDHRRLCVVAADLMGGVRGRVAQPILDPSPEAVLPQLQRAVRRLTARLGDGGSRVWGAGVVLPGLFEDGTLVRFGPSSVPEWSGFPLAEQLSARLGMPVLTENDATAAAIAEHLHGAGRGLRDMVYLYVGAGIGGGLIFSGHPYRGAGKAGELGHLVVEPGGRPCPCGNRGCLERYTSLTSAMAALTGRPEQEAEPDPERLEAALAAGEPAMQTWLTEAGHAIGRAVAALENLLDPEAIILGGAAPEAIFEALMQSLEPLPPGLGARADRARPRVLRAELGLDTPALGAAALPVFEGMVPSLALLAKPPRTGPVRLRWS
jgi:predicted NBD/HSP70 family sugar kinase